MEWLQMGDDEFGWSAGSAASSVRSGASVAGSGASSVADEPMMRALQDSFDATTRLTLAVQRTGQQLMAQGVASETINHNVSRCMELCKQLVPATEEINILLLKPMSQVPRDTAMCALKSAAGPFKQLQLFQEELEQLMRIQKKRSIGS